MDNKILLGLKRIDVSKDEEKTKERVAHIWKSSAKDLKRRVMDEYAVSQSTVYRIFREGAITPKVAIIMASVFNVDPFYLTGEMDEDEGYSERTLDRFLREKGYADLLDDIGFKPKRKYVRRDPGRESEESETLPNKDDLPEGITNVAAEEAQANVVEDVCDPVHTVELPEDELALLLHSLYIRARYSNSAKERLQSITDALLAD